MISGIGVDICDLRRLNHLDQLAKKILHEDEFTLYQLKQNDKSKREFIGGRFAVKEAFVKAVGFMPFKEICCLNDKNGKPYIKNFRCHVSISHENHYAIAFVVVENNDRL